jgi:integrase/recombinase XerD
MLEAYFVRPQTVDRIRASWIGPEIERYVVWLAEQGYSSRSVLRRVPLLVDFAEFGRVRGARVVGELCVHVDGFVVERQRRTRRRDAHERFVKEVRGPIEQILGLVVEGFVGSSRGRRAVPFADALPGFFEYLVCERGLRPASIASCQHHLVRFEAFLERIAVVRLSELSPPDLLCVVELLQHDLLQRPEDSLGLRRGDLGAVSDSARELCLGQRQRNSFTIESA